ncbi:MAG: nucleoside-diphosphate-sugar epimerase [Candidatus Omnitrophota bacterium]|jgi:nucleoside-diphosphate-sugar epimerase
MPTNFLIAGCGYLGIALGQKLKSAGHNPFGIARSLASIKRIELADIQPLQFDLCKINAQSELPLFDMAILCQAPNHQVDHYQSTYLDATASFLDYCKNKPNIKKIVFISSTSVYGDQHGHDVDERAVINPTTLNANAKTLYQAEQMLMSSKLPVDILRLAGLYGPERNRIQKIQDATFKPPLSEVITNRIHRDDAIQAIEIILKEKSHHEIYLGVDNESCTAKEFYTWLYSALNLNIPECSEAPATQSSKRCLNDKLKKLSFNPQYPSFRDGYKELLNL